MSSDTEAWRFRMFLDAGAGVCLWAANDAARSRFGYAVDHRRLGLPHDLCEALDQLMAGHDASIDWDDPGAVAPEDTASANRRLRDLAAMVAAALGPRHTVEAQA